MLSAGTAARRGKCNVDFLQRVRFSVFGEYLLEMGCPHKGKVKSASVMGIVVVLSKLIRG